MVQIIDTLHLCIALVPLSLYLIGIGLINLFGRPVVVSGFKDAAALGFGVSGFVMAGPMELFLPTATAFNLRGWVWLMLIAFYILSTTLLILLMRPRIVIYNVGYEQIRPILANVIKDLDRDARWAGDCLYLPLLGVQLHVESVSLARNVQLIATGAAQSFDGWARLETALKTALRESTGPRNVYGLSLVTFGFLLIAGVTLCAINDAEMVAQSLKEMLYVQD